MDVDGVVVEELSALFKARGERPPLTTESSLRELGFRSIDFAALALRVEEAAGRELDLGAGDLAGGLETVADLQAYFRSVFGA